VKIDLEPVHAFFAIDRPARTRVARASASMAAVKA
jgi:hypothetical protein